MELQNEKYFFLFFCARFFRSIATFGIVDILFSWSSHERSTAHHLIIVMKAKEILGRRRETFVEFSDCHLSRTV